jgi:hypothetical protein
MIAHTERDKQHLDTSKSCLPLVSLKSLASDISSIQ